MMKIAFNNSNLHMGLKDAHESPKRLEKCIKNLKKKYSEDYFINAQTNKKEALELIKDVHSSKYIDYLENYIPEKVICRNCGKKMDNKYSNSFSDFINNNKFCIHCDNDFDLKNVLSYPSIDTYFTPHTFDVILNSVYNIKLLLDDIKDNKASHGYALICPPGHHCNNKCDGFCIVNNVVVAAKYAQTIGYKKVLIIDYDFHHGDGTSGLIKNMDDIFMVSIHGFGDYIYPGTGNEQDNNNVLNIPLDITIDPESRKYIDDSYYTKLFIKKVLPYIHKINPDIILVSNGLDGHQDDPLEGFNLTDRTYVEIAFLLKQFNRPILYVSEGGYSSDVYNRVSDKIINIFNHKYSQYVYDFQHAYNDKLVLTNGNIKAVLTLDNIDENNYKDVIEFAFKNFYGCANIEKVKFFFKKKCITFDELEFSYFKDYKFVYFYKFLF